MAQTEPVALEPQIGALARAAAGDSEGFAALVRQHQRLVYSIAWHFFADRAVAEDISQEVFLQLHQSMGSIESDSHLVFWLRQVTSRKCIDHARWQDKRRHPSLDEIAEPGAAAAAPDVLANIRLRRLVAGLPEKLRAVVVLRFQEEMNPSEIAAALGWPLNSVKSRLHRALRLLRERIE